MGFARILVPIGIISQVKDINSNLIYEDETKEGESQEEEKGELEW